MKNYLVVLVLTALVWAVVRMSDHHDYTVEARVEFTGYDTVRYACLYADTLLPLTISSNGFNALGFSLRHQRPVVRVSVAGLDGPRHSLPVSACLQQVREQLGYAGIHGLASPIDSLHVLLSARASRTYRPSLDAVGFAFAEQYGLYGQPVIEPAEVTLYGPAEALEQISALHVAETTLAQIDRPLYCPLRLDPVWQRFPDVHPSPSEVVLTLPVESYVEQSFSVPVNVAGADTSITIRLYPDRVKVNVWVARNDLEHVSASDFSVSVDYGALLLGGVSAPVSLSRFPARVRPRDVEPGEIQYVIIKR